MRLSRLSPLLTALLASCTTPIGGPDERAGGALDNEPFFDVIFSPQAIEQSHTARIARILEDLNRTIDEQEGGDGSAHSIDIAMYSFSDAAIKSALRESIQRGVSVRMVFEPARTEASHPEGSKSAGFEDLG